MSFSRLIQPFGKNPKSTNEIIIALKDELTSNTSLKKSTVEIVFSYLFPSDSHKNIYHLLKIIREMIYGSIDSVPESQQIRDQICSELQKIDLLVILIDKLPNIGFDGRKDIALIHEYAIAQQIGTRFPTVEYIVLKPVIIQELVQYYTDQHLVTICGQIIREFLRFEELTEMFFKLKDKNLQKLYLKFLDYVKTDSFIVCADVFVTLHELFCRHKTLAKEVLQLDYRQFFEKLNELLLSDDYYVRRKSIKLLFEILFDRNHQTVMKKYIEESSNLLIITKIMKSDCFHSSFDAFLVFYLFVMNPKKSFAVKRVLFEDKNSLIAFIDSFQTNRPNVRQYDNEKKEIIKTLNEINKN